MRLIDFENHFYDVSVPEALANRVTPPMYNKETDIITWYNDINMPQGKLMPPLLNVGDERVKLMDELGIDTAVISCSPGAETLDKEESVIACKATNRALYEVTKKYPGRFLGSAILPVKDIDESVKELEKCVKEYGFVAWHTHSNYGDTSPDDIQYRVLFNKAAELGIYVYLHPQLTNNPRLKGYGFGLAGPALGFTLDTLTSISRLILSGIFDEIPDLKIVLGHLGEAMPFLLDRMDNRIRLIPNDPIKNKELPSYYFKKNIMVSVSGNMSPAAFKCTKDVLGIDNIVFATDHPFENAKDMVEFVKNLSLTEEEREKLCFKNAEKLGISQMVYA